MVGTTKDIVKECLLQYHNEVIKPKLNKIEAEIIDSKSIADKLSELEKSITINEAADSVAINKINTIQKETSRHNSDITKLGKKLTEAEKKLAEANNNAELLTAVKLAINELKEADIATFDKIKSMEELQEYYYNKLDRVIDILNMELDKIYGSIYAILPEIPKEDGSYTLSLTIVGGIPTYTWVKA